MLTSSHLLPPGYQQRGPCRFSTIQTIDIHFRFFQYYFPVAAYFANQVASTKILVAMAPKEVAALRVVIYLTDRVIPCFEQPACSIT